MTHSIKDPSLIRFQSHGVRGWRSCYASSAEWYQIQIATAIVLLRLIIWVPLPGPLGDCAENADLVSGRSGTAEAEHERQIPPPKRGTPVNVSSRFGFLIDCRFRNCSQGLIRRFLLFKCFLKKFGGVVRTGVSPPTRSACRGAICR